MKNSKLKNLLIIESLLYIIPFVTLCVLSFIIHGIGLWLYGSLSVLIVGIISFPYIVEYWFKYHLRDTLRGLKVTDNLPDIPDRKMSMYPAKATKFAPIAGNSIRHLHYLNQYITKSIDDLKVSFILFVFLLLLLSNLGTIYFSFVLLSNMGIDLSYVILITLTLCIVYARMKTHIHNRLVGYFADFNDKIKHTFKNKLDDPFAISLDEEPISFTDKNLL